MGCTPRFYCRLVPHAASSAALHVFAAVEIGLVPPEDHAMLLLLSHLAWQQGSASSPPVCMHAAALKAAQKPSKVCCDKLEYYTHTY